MAKPESKFTTQLRKDFKRQKVWFYKIPDTPPTDRFTPAKPFDVVLCVKGGMVGLEIKFHDFTKKSSGNVRFNNLRESQINGLSDVLKAEGLSYVGYGIKWRRGEIRAYFWEFQIFKEVCQKFDGKIPKDVLEKTPYFLPDASGNYNLTNTVEEMTTNINYQYLIGN